MTNTVEECKRISRKMDVVEAMNGDNSRSGWDTEELANMCRDAMNEKAGEDNHITCDRGGHISPRWCVIEKPKVGDEVSKCFNGDYYPKGTIVKISDSLRRIETSTGTVFWRRKKSSSWISGGTWSMIKGHVSRMNPEF